MIQSSATLQARWIFWLWQFWVCFVRIQSVSVQFEFTWCNRVGRRCRTLQCKYNRYKYLFCLFLSHLSYSMMIRYTLPRNMERNAELSQTFLPRETNKVNLQLDISLNKISNKLHEKYTYFCCMYCLKWMSAQKQWCILFLLAHWFIWTRIIKHVEN